MNWFRMGFCRLIQRKLGMALSLSARDWWMLTQAWFLLLMFDLGLRLLPFRQVQRVAARAMRRGEEQRTAQAWAAIQRTQRLVGIAARYHLYPMRCLPRALALQWLLNKQGIRTELRIGVRKEGAQFSAHAWLEYEGRALEAPDVAERFVPLIAAEAER
ncbi:MAG: lasso peptide biosynthesis B2 protein [Chloroflexi bacterium]|nr:lasso peptide biosynthesis B2 protein [Chloroflexota bacterium]